MRLRIAVAVLIGATIGTILLEMTGSDTAATVTALVGVVVVVPALTALLVCQHQPGVRAAMILGAVAALSPFMVRLPGHLQHPVFTVEPAMNVGATAAWFALIAAVGAFAAAGSMALVARFQPGRAP